MLGPVAMWGRIVAVLTATSLAYHNSLSGDFVHDDLVAITSNPDVLGNTSWTRIWADDFWGKPMMDPTSHKSYRPLTTLTFRLNMAVSGTNVWSYHAVNVLLHGAATLLVLMFCLDALSLSAELAAGAALLFAVHPVHTEAVASLVGRADVLCCVFYLSSLHAFLRCRGRPKLLAASVIGAALALLSKEQGVTVLCLSLGYQLLSFFDHYKKKRQQKKVVQLTIAKEFYIKSCVLLISLLVLLTFRWWILHGSLPQFSDQDNPAAFHPSRSTRFLTYCYLIVFNLRLLVFPSTLSYDWQMGSIPLVSGPGDVRNLVTLAGAACLALLLWHLMARASADDRRRLYLSLGLLVFPFLPASNLFVTVGFVVAERILYIPSVGFCLLVSQGLQRLLERSPLLARGCTVCLLAVFLWRTLARNTVWASREALFKSGLESVPGNAKVHYNFANLQKDLGEVELAIRHYKTALRLWPEHASAHNNLGTLLDDTEEAELHFKIALQIDPFHAKAHLNLANIYSKRGDTEAAVRLLERAVELEPSFAGAYSALASLYSAAGREREAGRFHELAVSLDPSPDNLNNYGAFLQKTGQSSAAVQKYREALALQPNHTVALVNAAKSLRALEHPLEAEDLYNRALSILEDPEILDSLGVLYINTGRQRDARELYAHLNDKFPDHIEGKVHYAQVLLQERRFPQAESLLLSAVQDRPSHREALRLLSALYCQLNRTTEALDFIGRAIAHCDGPPACARLHAEHGDLMKDLNDFESAQNSYTMALLLDSNLAHAHLNLAVIHHLRGRYSEAERHYQAAYYLDSSHKLLLENMEKLRKTRCCRQL